MVMDFQLIAPFGRQTRSDRLGLDLIQRLQRVLLGNCASNEVEDVRNDAQVDHVGNARHLRSGQLARAR